MTGLFLRAAGENVRMDSGRALDRNREIILQPARKMQNRFRWRIVLDQRGIAGPADFHTAEQIGLGACHPEQPRRIEFRLVAKDLRIGFEAYAGAAPVVDLAELLEPALRRATHEGHFVELLAARDLDFHLFRKRVHHRHAHAMQAARGLVDLRIELSTRMEGAHDDFEGGLFREFRVRIDRDAAPVVGHREPAIG